MRRHDLCRRIAALPPHLQQCCDWLIEGSISEAARRSGLARGSIYGRIATLQRRCQEAGLDIYLGADPTRRAVPGK